MNEITITREPCAKKFDTSNPKHTGGSAGHCMICLKPCWNWQDREANAHDGADILAIDIGGTPTLWPALALCDDCAIRLANQLLASVRPELRANAERAARA